MAKLEIKYSSAQVQKPKVPSSQGITIDPYYATVAGAGFTKLGAFYDKVIKETRVQNDKNEVRKRKITIAEKIQTEYAKYGNSDNPEDIKLFLANTDFSNFKTELKGANKNVKNGIEAFVLSTQNDLRWKLFSQISATHVKETLAGDQDDLDKITLKMAANDIKTRSDAYTEFNSWFNNEGNSSTYNDVEYKKLKDDKLAQAKRYQLEFGIKNDPFSVLRHPEKLAALDNELAAKELYKEAQVVAVNQQTQIDWDAIQLEEASTAEKINNFSEIITRMNTWKEDPNWRSKVPSLDDINDMLKLDQINSAQAAVLLDFYINPNKVSDREVIEMINAQFSIAQTVEDIDDIEQLVNFDQAFASKLNIKDISKYKTQFEKHRSDFSAAQEATDFEEKLRTNMGKLDQVRGILLSGNTSLSTQEKEIRDLAVGYYKDLVYEKNVLPSDAYIQTIDKFTTSKNMPTIYNVVPLTSINLPVVKANEPTTQKKYFSDRRKEVAEAYRDGTIDIKVLMEDLAGLDVIEDLFVVRAELKDEAFAFLPTKGKEESKPVDTGK